MAAYLAPFYEQLRALVAATWPEVVDHGVYRDVEFAEGSKTDLAKKAKHQELPFALFTYRPKEASEWGTAFRGGDGPLGVLYVAGDSVSRDELTAKLEALRDALDGFTDTNCQVIGHPEVQDTVSAPFLQAFFAAVERPFNAGAVMARVVTG